MSKAYCPSSISLIFKPCKDNNLIRMGSVGVGFTIDKGVMVDAEKSQENAIFLNGSEADFPTVKKVLDLLSNQKVKLSINSSLPIACGFGVSGASTLACALAVDELYGLGNDMLCLAQIAHIAEIMENTGLGSVGTQYEGGFLVKKTPGLPFKATRFPFEKKKIYAVILGKLETSTVLSDRKALSYVEKAADWALDKIEDNISLEEMIDISFEFAKRGKLVRNKKVASVINNIRGSGGHATMAILGQVVISDIKPKLSRNYNIEKLTITDDRPRLISEVKIPIIKH